jgi:hypothetical protein
MMTKGKAYRAASVVNLHSGVVKKKDAPPNPQAQARAAQQKAADAKAKAPAAK